MPIRLFSFHEFQRVCERVIIAIAQNASPSQFLALTSAFGQNICLVLLLYLPLRYAARFDGLRPAAQPLTTDSLQILLPSLKAEWMMLNVVSMFLLGAVIGTFQLSNVMAITLTRTVAFMSLAFAAVSIVYSCVFLVHFSVWSLSSRGTGENTDENINVIDYLLNKWTVMLNNINQGGCVLWNAWVFLALPVIWCSWSAITFVLELLIILWHINMTTPATATGLIVRGPTATGHKSTDRAAEFIPCVAVTVVLTIGGIYLAMIIRALRS